MFSIVKRYRHRFGRHIFRDAVCGQFTSINLDIKLKTPYVYIYIINIIILSTKYTINSHICSI